MEEGKQDEDLEQIDLIQLIYISAANHEFSEEELSALLEQARKNNESLNISGMLLYHGGSFIQALEGERELVEALYQKIGADPRHSETQVLFRGEIKERDFEGWSMGFYRSRQTSAENLEGFHQFLQGGLRTGKPEDSGRARKALQGFREGKWRAAVDHG